MTFVNDPGPPVSMLPRDLDDVSSFQAMVGAMTDAHEKVEIAKRYRVNKDIILKLFHWYKKYNINYEHVSIDAAQASKIPHEFTWPVEDRTNVSSVCTRCNVASN
jgi:hypothetical protein